MSDIAIKVENLSKKYQIGARQGPYRTLRETLTGAASAPFRRLQSAFRRSEARASKGSDEFWALRDVSFEVRRGEVVGVIGRNGAGKSTLLKILSRITEPSGGYADIYGRVGSLLEVGTGFHPELTGRENVYLNGAILGMRRAEIDRQFDAIVDFAEVERFIDTPVKHYSSGMYLRLAFAVAAHLEPEILIIDEVLAVGDIAFQQKCLGKMGEVAKEGRTVLFVSHNLGAVARLCQVGMVLESGAISKWGRTDEIILHYTQKEASTLDMLADVRGVFVDDLRAANAGNNDIAGNVIDATRELVFSFDLHVHEKHQHLKLLLVLRDENQFLLVRDVNDCQEFPFLHDEGVYKIQVKFPTIWLSPGSYSCHVKVVAEASDRTQRYTSDPLLFFVNGKPKDDGSQNGEILSPACSWNVFS